jgi:hypothetical protein
VELIFKSRTFLLELFDYGLNQCFWHEVILSLVNWTSSGSCGRGLFVGTQFPLLDEIPLWASTSGCSLAFCKEHDPNPRTRENVNEGQGRIYPKSELPSDLRSELLCSPK